nr:MAG TPA: hypothetical protein [Caudoviricetes sp.]
MRFENLQKQGVHRLKTLCKNRPVLCTIYAVDFHTFPPANRNK